MYKQCNIQKIGRAGQSSFSHEEEDDILQRYRNIMNQQNNMILQQQHIGRVESDESLPTSLQRLQQPILVDIQDHVTRHKKMKKLKRQRRSSSSNRKSRRSSSQHHRGRRSSSSSTSSSEESSSSTSSKGCSSLSEIVDVALTKMADVIFDSMPSCDSCADWMDASTPSKCSVFENRCM